MHSGLFPVGDRPASASLAPGRLPAARRGRAPPLHVPRLDRRAAGGSPGAVLGEARVPGAEPVLLPRRVTRLLVTDLLGAHSLGNCVHGWPIVATVIGLDPLDARICTGSRCDFNGDGIADVRDLVLMVHCILGNGPCPNPSPSDLD